MEHILMNQDWYFEDFSNGIKKLVTLPHDGTIGTERDPYMRLGFLSANFYGVQCQYTKSVFIPKEYSEKALYLKFGGIYRDFSITINGREAYQFSFGFIPVHFRMDHLVKYGEENEICVKINTPRESHNRWYAGTGIYQDVQLCVTEKTHITMYGVKITTISYEPAKITVDVEVMDESGLSPEVIITILDQDRRVAGTTGSIASAAGCHSELLIPEAKLWSADSPNLYQLKVELVHNGKLLDEQWQTFGIRTLAWAAESGFLVNGMRTLLRGGCIHNDNGVIGMVINRATEERRIKNLKASGFNAIRSAHHPISTDLLDMCDKYGMYVMDESFDTWYRMKQLNGFHQKFFEFYEQVTETMVLKDYNHPSVIMYSIGNEITEFGSLKAVRAAKRMLEIIRGIDKTRPSTLCPSMHMAREFLEDMPYATMDEDEYLSMGEEYVEKDRQHFINLYLKAISNNPDPNADPYPAHIVAEDEATTLPLYTELDIAGYNYYSDKFDKLHELHPERLLLGTETRGHLIYKNWNYIKEHPYAIGDFIWTLQDHIGECNVCGVRYPAKDDAKESKGGHNLEGRGFPWILNDGGVIDLIGHLLPAIHKYRFCWGGYQGLFLASQPPIHDGIAPVYGCYKWTDSIECWSYEGYEGKKSFIDVYSDAAEVEVLINGISLGRRKPVEYFAKFECIYEPGEVVGIGYDVSGAEIYRNHLVSANKETCLKVTADKEELIAGGSDFAFLNIDITDTKGIIKALPERTVTVQVEGAGSLQGLGSANPVNGESYCSSTHTSYHGRLLAVLRSKNHPGDIKVTVQSEGMKDVIITMKCL